MAPVEVIDQIANSFDRRTIDPRMPDDIPDLETERLRRQPPVPLTLVVFLAAVLGFMTVVVGVFALMRLIGRAF